MRSRIGQRPNEHPINDRKHRCVETDTKRKRHAGGGRDDGCASEHPEREADVPVHIVYPPIASGVPVQLSNGLNTPERETCLPMCLFSRQAPASKLILQKGEMRRQLTRAV